MLVEASPLNFATELTKSFMQYNLCEFIIYLTEKAYMDYTYFIPIPWITSMEHLWVKHQLRKFSTT